MSVIDELLDLQEQDSVIKSLEKQVHDIPKRRKLEQEKLEDYQRELDQAREALDRAQKVEAQSQLDSDQQAAQIAKYEKQRQEVKTNNEYAALGRQIDSCRRVKAEYDERIAKAREHIEAVQENIAMFEARLAEESAQVEGYVDELRAQLVEAQEKLLAAHGLAVDYVEAVDADTLKPVKAIRKGVAVLLAAYAGKTRLIDNRLF